MKNGVHNDGKSSSLWEIQLEENQDVPKWKAPRMK